MFMQQVIKISLNLSYSEKLLENFEVDFPLKILCVKQNVQTSNSEIRLWHLLIFEFLHNDLL